MTIEELTKMIIISRELSALSSLEKQHHLDVITSIPEDLKETRAGLGSRSLNQEQKKDLQEMLSRISEEQRILNREKNLLSRLSKIIRNTLSA